MENEFYEKTDKDIYAISGLAGQRQFYGPPRDRNRDRNPRINEEESQEDIIEGKPKLQKIGN